MISTYNIYTNKRYVVSNNYGKIMMIRHLPMLSHIIQIFAESKLTKLSIRHLMEYHTYPVNIDSEQITIYNHLKKVMVTFKYRDTDLVLPLKETTNFLY